VTQQTERVEGSTMEEIEPGAVVRQPLLDLSHFSTPEDLAAITRIERVATVVVPNSLAVAYARIPTVRVANTVFVPDGSNVRVHTGPLVVGGDGLGGPEDVLIVTGVLVVTSPVTEPLPYRISVIGSVLAPRGSESALGPLLGSSVGSTMYYRYAPDQEIKVHAGQVRLTGGSLANPAGGPDDVLLIAGQLVLSGPISTVGYGQIVVAGQLVAPESARAELEPRLQVQGQVVWARSDRPRIVLDDAEYGADFFRLLDEPISLVVLGDLTISPGVTEETLRAKVADIALLGDLIAPKELVPILQVLAVDSVGDIRVSDGSGS
jgi:hypothetical protein